MQFLCKKFLCSSPYLFLLILLLCSVDGPAQETPEIDSLKNLLTDQQDSIQVDVWHKLSMSYQNYVPDSAMRYAQQALTLSENLNYNKGIADAMLHIGRLKRDKGNYTSALEDMFISLKYYEEMDDSVQIANNYNDISIVYALSEDSETSRGYFHKALDIFRSIGDKQGESYALNNIGLIYEQEENLEKAKEFYLASMSIKIQRKDGYGISRGYNTLGSLSSNQGNYQEALSYFFKADSLFVKLNDEASRPVNFNAIAKAYFAMGNLPKARTYAQQSYEIAQQLNSTRYIELILKTLAEISAAQRDFEAAYRYQVLHEAANDSLHQESREKHLAKLKAEFDDEQQKTEITLLKQEKLLQEASISHQQTIIISLVAGLIMILFFSVALYLANNRNKKKNKLLASKNQEIHQQAGVLSEQKNHLEKINKTKDKLFSIVSHDIRSPLNTLKGFSYLLTQQIDAMDKEEMQRVSRRINFALDNLSQLLDNLLNWSLIQTGHKKSEFTSIDINALINFNIDLYQATAAEKGIQLLNQSEQQLYAYADYQSINTVIRNFISNSIKFSYPNSSIFIRAQYQNNTVEVSIIDQGIGMSDEVINKIFSADKKESQKGTHNESGSGFGLTLCHELILQNHGQIQVSSKLREGSTFSFFLPIGKSKEVKVLQ
ncbi:tetratricopeptide repeat-containing sensor histidine kinase [Catalinimonas niigatensis]|uniref:tetratricopeptide repeat-containing sensor histidine kinase n=1 Tax=Catalinimonas niigatensis TaxID=1397264 RepID=UPI0026667BFC|nr:tetratricopeptide repeat-containing sensor histidine kinase [Catalinimonas niigatensis]WPP49298.1 tetratricopeptide repeat-containing sensor histidine kinase [Catalinimonas niigatensis]